MIIINRTDKNIVGAINGKPFSIPFNEQLYTKLVKISEDFVSSTELPKANALLEEANKLTILNFKELIATSNPYLHYNPVKDLYYLVVNKGKKDEYVIDKPLPVGLSERIVESFEKGFSFMPIIKAWIRFLQRDKEYSETDAAFFSRYLNTMYIDYEAVDKLVETEGLSEDTAVERCTFNDLAITQEGLLATYKVVNEIKTEWVLVTDEEGNVVLNSDDSPQKKQVLKKEYQSQYDIDPLTGETKTTVGKPVYVEDRYFTPAIHKHGENFYSGDKYGYIYKVGEAQYLPKINPNTNESANVNKENSFGGGGLYTGGLNYIKNYRSQGDVVLVCFLDPANIISFQDDGSAMRTWELFPHNILEDDVTLKGLYHSSQYAKESSAKTILRLQEIADKEREALDKKSEEISNLNKI